MSDILKMINSPPSELLIAEKLMAANFPKKAIHKAVRDHMGVTKPLTGYSFHVWCAIREDIIRKYAKRLPSLAEYLDTITVKGDHIRNACRERQAKLARAAKRAA